MGIETYINNATAHKKLQSFTIIFNFATNYFILNNHEETILIPGHPPQRDGGLRR